MTSEAAPSVGSAPVEWWHFDFAASGGRDDPRAVGGAE